MEQEHLKSMSEEVTRLEQTVTNLLTLIKVVSQKYELRTFLSLVLRKARLLTQSDAGSIYLIDREDAIPYICFAVSQNSSHPEKSLEYFAVPLDRSSLVGYVAVTGETLNIPDVQALPPDAPYSHKKTIEAELDYISRSILTLPVVTSQGEVAAVIQLINRKVSPEVVVKPDNLAEVVVPFTDWDVELLRGLSSLVGIAIERQELMNKIYE
ncbi:MAG: GAF domain-containing protein [Pseudanabaenaceae cyanobacterium SKYGB_i_bin29]|nr:GAF domain-containing protein [Pseudanabaenaceae cyanobacterium SKYG29]MDW8421070.1 GAF domain-containing protein [Pseudanabaenaceae cyanobacterium SKYGB_i_bin29]